MREVKKSPICCQALLLPTYCQGPSFSCTISLTPDSCIAIHSLLVSLLSQWATPMTSYIASKMASFTLLILITSLPSRAREPFALHIYSMVTSLPSLDTPVVGQNSPSPNTYFLSLNTFLIFFSFLNKFEQFLCHWTAQIERLQMFFQLHKQRSNTEKHRKEEK